MAGGKSSKKKVQLGVKPIGGSNVVKSRKMARRITSQFHVIQKRKQKILAMPNGNERESKLKELEAELHSLGGIDRYQQASVVSTQHFKTSKWVLQALRRLGKLPSDNKLKTLEVGAINDQLYQSQSLDVRAIDVNSQLPCIEECDFFNVLPEFQYDVVVCSMVINCVFHPFKRGEMLLRLLCQLRPDGVLFLILPTRCLTTIHIQSQDNFQSILETIGFSLIEPVHNTPHLTFFILRGRSECLAIRDSTISNVDKPNISSKKQEGANREDTWKAVVGKYFQRMAETTPESVASLAPYRATKDIDEVPETEDFSILFSKEFFAYV
jgi:hypothetical protein